jgi:hypothetical protein
VAADAMSAAMARRPNRGNALNDVQRAERINELWRNEGELRTATEGAARRAHNAVAEGSAESALKWAAAAQAAADATVAVWDLLGQLGANPEGSDA